MGAGMCCETQTAQQPKTEGPKIVAPKKHARETPNVTSSGTPSIGIGNSIQNTPGFGEPLANKNAEPSKEKSIKDIKSEAIKEAAPEDEQDNMASPRSCASPRLRKKRRHRGKTTCSKEPPRDSHMEPQPEVTEQSERAQTIEVAMPIEASPLPAPAEAPPAAEAPPLPPPAEPPPSRKLPSNTAESRAPPPEKPIQAEQSSHGADFEEDEWRASHILIKHKGSRNPVSRRTGESTARRSESSAINELKRLLPGLTRTNFAAKAKAHSDCSSFKEGGDLDWFGPGDMQAPFEAATRSLRVGEMSGIVSTDSGVHIILRTE